MAPRDPALLLSRLEDPAIRIVSLTVTEKAYGLDVRTGGLDLTHPDVAADPEEAIGHRLVVADRRVAVGHRDTRELEPDAELRIAAQPRRHLGPRAGGDREQRALAVERQVGRLTLVRREVRIERGLEEQRAAERRLAEDAEAVHPALVPALGLRGHALAAEPVAADAEADRHRIGGGNSRGEEKRGDGDRAHAGRSFTGRAADGRARTVNARAQCVWAFATVAEISDTPGPRESTVMPSRPPRSPRPAPQYRWSNR